MENPSFRLEGIVREKDSMQDFEGPLSLILMLLQKNKIEIRDLSVSDILDQYLEYLDRMQSLDLEIASEFVQMAAHLLYLKTRTLLTTEEEVSELELLMQSLEQLQARDRFAAMSVVIPRLKAASEKGFLYMTKQPEPLPAKKQEYAYHHEPVDLLKAMLGIWTRGTASTPESERRLFAAMPRRIVYSVRDKGLEIINRLRKGPQSLSGLYGRCSSSRVDEQIILHFSGSDDEIEKVLESFEEES